jgi:hypothetical protein
MFLEFVNCGGGGRLFLFFLDFHWFKVFGFEDLTAVQTLNVVHAVSSGDYLGTSMVASGLHTLR